MSNQYTTLGSWFEYLNDDCDYEKWSQYLIEKLLSLDICLGDDGIDIGCGNGTFCRVLYKYGFNIYGVDVSQEMLNKAKELAIKDGLNCQFMMGDILKLKVLKKQSFAIAINDCINYIAPKDIPTAFKKVRGVIKKGGVFIFDISTKYKLESVLGNNVFCEDRDELTYVWFNSFDGQKVSMDLTFFIKQENGTYVREDERHEQYAHEEDDIISALTNSAFEVLAVEGHLGKDKTQRINFICRGI